MKKCSWLILLALLLTLLGGCSGDAGILKSEKVFMRTETSVQEGHLFFTGKVLSVSKLPEQITYYDEPVDQNTFYEVEVTDDYFNCIPDRTVTVCIYGTVANNVSRHELQKDGEYLFDVTAWMRGNEVVFLLPSFYSVLAEREGEYLYYTEADLRYSIDATYEEYKEALIALAEQHSYGPALVFQKIKANLEQAKTRDEAYFKELKFKAVDGTAIATTVAGAKLRLQQLSATQETWEGVRKVLK